MTTKPTDTLTLNLEQTVDLVDVLSRAHSVIVESDGADEHAELIGNLAACLTTIHDLTADQREAGDRCTIACALPDGHEGLCETAVEVAAAKFDTNVVAPDDVPKYVAVAAALNALGVACTVEYPGYIDVSWPALPTTGTPRYWGIGDAGTGDGSWGGSLLDINGNHYDSFELDNSKDWPVETVAAAIHARLLVITEEHKALDNYTPGTNVFMGDR